MDALSGYLVLGQALYHSSEKYSGAWNFSPPSNVFASVEDVVNLMKEKIKKINLEFVTTKAIFDESHFLSLDSTKAQKHLGWKSRWNFNTSMEQVSEWYPAYLNSIR